MATHASFVDEDGTTRFAGILATPQGVDVAENLISNVTNTGLGSVTITTPTYSEGCGIVFGTADPTAGGGAGGGAGYIYIRAAGSGTEVWVKSGAMDTQWTKLATVP